MYDIKLIMRQGLWKRFEYANCWKEVGQSCGWNYISVENERNKWPRMSLFVCNFGLIFFVEL